MVDMAKAARGLGFAEDAMSWEAKVRALRRVP